MSGVKARKWVVRSHFVGQPKREDLEIVEEELPPIKDGEFLCEAQWLTVDPYMRLFVSTIPLGGTMIGGQVARVTESKNKDYAIGDMVVARFGWRTHTISDGTSLGMNYPQLNTNSDGTNKEMSYPPLKIDPSIQLRASTALGILGMTGATAYFGFLELCRPKEGETLVVNGAAGAVGSAVGQIAKIKGCKVVGFAGSDAKVEYLKQLGFDAAYNYKTIKSLDETLKEACPNGIDMFFDNVGGEWFETVLSNMNTFGRVAICGAISQSNLTEPPKFRPVSGLILLHQLRVEGFLANRWFSQWPDAFKELAKWIQEGKLKYHETVTEGFNHMFDAFLGLFTGENLGKAVVKA